MRPELGNEFGVSFLSKMDGDSCSEDWKGGIYSCKVTTKQDSKIMVKMDINNSMKDRKILNIFGAIQGSEEPGNSNYIVAQARGELPSVRTTALL